MWAVRLDLFCARDPYVNHTSLNRFFIETSRHRSALIHIIDSIGCSRSHLISSAPSDLYTIAWCKLKTKDTRGWPTKYSHIFWLIVAGKSAYLTSKLNKLSIHMWCTISSQWPWFIKCATLRALVLILWLYASRLRALTVFLVCDYHASRACLVYTLCAPCVHS